MAPRKSARTASKADSQPPAAPPLDGCSIAISGTFPGATQAAVQAKITALGAAIAKSVKSDTTHLVTTQVDYDKVSAKVKAAKDLDIPIVSLDWITDCTENSKKEDEASYHFNAAVPSPGPAPGNKGKKRAAASAAPSDSEDEEDAKPQPKKQKAAVKSKGKAKGKAKAKEVDEPEDSEQEDTKPVTKKEKAGKAVLADGQTAKSKDLKVPVDECCSISSCGVFIDPVSNMIWDASLNQTNAGNNNNKFYRLQILTDGIKFRTWTRWGRVGERGQNAILGNGSLDDAIKNFEKKFKDKSGLLWSKRLDPPKPGKYVFIERNYNDDSDEEDDAAVTKKEDDDDYTPPESKLHPAIQELMALIFNTNYFAATMMALNYDAKKLPLGKLSKNHITRGFQALKDLSNALNNPSVAGSGGQIQNLSDLYYSLIPHSFGRNRPPTITTSQMLKKEVELLESLSDMKDAANIMKVERDTEELHIFDRQYQGLNMQEMTPLDPKSDEFRLLAEYLKGTQGSTHSYLSYQVEQIFRIEREGERDRFQNSEYMKIPSDRRLLWHGSRATNFGGILSQGLRIAPPEAPVSGYMFGKGIYLADMSSKSAGYCCAGITGGTGLLLLCEAELGDPMQKLVNASYNAGEDAKKMGTHSTWGQGRTGPLQWKDAECVHPSLKGIQMPDTSKAPGDTNVPGASLFYNEYICYDVAQVHLRYLFRVKM